MLRAAPRAQGQGDDRADAGREPARLRPGRDRRATGNIRRFLEKPGEDEITCNTINAGIYVLEPETFDRIPKDTAWSIERSYFPSLIERGETFVAYVYDGYWIDIGTPAKYLQVHHDIMDGRYSAPPFAGTRRSAAWVSPEARVEDGVEMQGPCFVDEGAVVKAGARILPYSVIGRQTHVDEAAVIDDSIIWPNGWIGREATVRGAILGRNCHIGRNVDRRQPGACSATRRSSRTTAGYEHQPSIFKAYDVRGLYPSEVNEDGGPADRPRLRQLSGRQAHRGLARHAAVVAVGGGGVHRRRPRAGRRRRRLRDDGHRHDVLRRRARRPRRRRADHRVAQSRRSTTASRWCGARRFRSAATPASATSAT